MLQSVRCLARSRQHTQAAFSEPSKHASIMNMQCRPAHPQKAALSAQAAQAQAGERRCAYMQTHARFAKGFRRVSTNQPINGSQESRVMRDGYDVSCQVQSPR